MFVRELVLVGFALASWAPLGCREQMSSPTTGQATTTTTAASVPFSSHALSPEELRQRKAQLTPEQYRVTQRNGTEPPFRNAYADEHAPGIYVDVVSGEPLFSSREKYDSHTGWPSFYAPLEAENVRTRSDHELGAERTEVRSVHADSHLGHVFDDGPAPTGLRYCMNSAALRFVPAERLTAEGYGSYAHLFPNVSQVKAPGAS